MAFTDVLPTQSLEKVAPFAFLVGGLSILIDVVLVALDNFDVMTQPEWLNPVLGLGGIWVVLIGLVGYYSLVARPAPRLALGGLLASAVGWIALTVGLGWAIVLDLTGQGTIAEGPSFGPQIFVSALALALLSFLLYGVASERTDRPSRTLGLVLLVPFVAFLVLILLFLGSNVLQIDPPEGVPIAMFGLAALGLMAVGYVLRSETVPA